jgi:branched-chain amino acid transport system ATP-binding protein
MTLLEVTDIHTAYGQIVVNRGVSLTVDEGEIVTVLGPNGAGKSTLLRAISGLLKPTKGAIRFQNKDMTRLPTEEFAKRGIVLVPEGRRVFSGLTVRENLQLGAYARRDRKAVQLDLERMEAYFPVLAERRDARAGQLSGGQQQMLAIARGLMASPRILLLDEPSLGLSPLLVAEIRNVILDVCGQFGAAVLLVEQNAGLALAVGVRGYLINHGRIAVSGSINELRDAGLVRELYLGAGRANVPRSGVPG